MPEDKEKGEDKKYPEIWRMFDGVGTYLGYISENPESSPAPDKFHILVNGRENPYLDELVWTFHTLGEEIYELPEHSDGEPGSYVIAPVDKEEALSFLTRNVQNHAVPEDEYDIQRQGL